MKKMTPKERKDITWDRYLRQPWMIDTNPYIDLMHCECMIKEVEDENSIKRLNNDMVLKLAHVTEILRYRTKELPIGRKIETIPLYNDLIMDLRNTRDMIVVAKIEMNKNFKNETIRIIMQNACTIIDHYIMIYDGVKTRPTATIIDLNQKRQTLRLQDKQSLPKR